MTDSIVEGLQRPSAFPWKPDSVELIETHISWVFLAGDRVVKVKRPVDLGFVDFTTLERRHHFCHEEVRLNQRLTAGVYIGVAPVVSTSEGFKVAGEGDIVDWCTVMRRLPDNCMLDAIIREGMTPDDLAELLSGRLIPFHRQVAEACHGEDSEYLAIVTENLDQLALPARELLPSLQLDLVDTSVRSFIDKHRSRLSARLSAWIREGHGDLRAEHICLESDGQVQIFDCVEFSETIRCADVASDLAFLLMDLRRLGGAELAAELLRRYRAAGFVMPDPVVSLYSGHRAMVRVKVACLEAGDATEEIRQRHRSEAADYLNLATAAVLQARPVVIAVSGLSGSGKSAVAAALARALGAAVHSSDEVRKQLAGIPASQPAPASWQGGIYSPAWTSRTYEYLRIRAMDDVDRGVPTIVDATLLDNDERRGFADAARDANVPLVIIDTVCDERVLLDRIRSRQQRGTSASDAGEEIYRRQRLELERVPPIVPDGVISATVDTSADGPINLDPVLQALTHADLLSPLSWAED